MVLKYLGGFEIHQTSRILEIQTKETFIHPGSQLFSSISNRYNVASTSERRRRRLSGCRRDLCAPYATVWSLFTQGLGVLWSLNKINPFLLFESPLLVTQLDTTLPDLPPRLHFDLLASQNSISLIANLRHPSSERFFIWYAYIRISFDSRQEQDREESRDIIHYNFAMRPLWFAGL